MNTYYFRLSYVDTPFIPLSPKHPEPPYFGYQGYVHRHGPIGEMFPKKLRKKRRNRR